MGHPGVLTFSLVDVHVDVRRWHQLCFEERQVQVLQHLQHHRQAASAGLHDSEQQGLFATSAQLRPEAVLEDSGTRRCMLRRHIQQIYGTNLSKHACRQTCLGGVVYR